jgi:hypothetical protein
MHLILNEPHAAQELLQQPPDQLIIEPQKLITKKQSKSSFPLKAKRNWKNWPPVSITLFFCRLHHPPTYWKIYSTQPAFILPKTPNLPSQELPASSSLLPNWLSRSSTRILSLARPSLPSPVHQPAIIVIDINNTTPLISNTKPQT